MNLATIANLGSAVIKTGVNFLLGTPERKNNLDPMITMIQLGMLGFMKIGTKIGFYDNCLQIQRPGWYQIYSRSKHQDEHEELDKLEQIIRDAIRFYRPSKDDTIREIFSYAAAGLQQLRNTYIQLKKPNVPGTLAHVISIIETNVTCQAPIKKENGESSDPQASSKKKQKATQQEVQPEPSDEPIKPGTLVVKEEEDNNIPAIMKKVIAIWNKDAYREVLECFSLVKGKQGSIPVDVKELGIRELELLQSLIDHKINRLNYVLDAEMHMTSI